MTITISIVTDFQLDYFVFKNPKFMLTYHNKVRIKMIDWAVDGSHVNGGGSNSGRWLLLAVYILVFQVTATNQRTSTHWRLNEQGFIVSGVGGGEHDEGKRNSAGVRDSSSDQVNN